MIKDLEKYEHIQRIARNTIDYLRKNIRSGLTEKEIVAMAEEHMNRHGIVNFWYYGVGAFVLVGKRTIISVSGKEYVPTDTKVQNSDIVTIDLSPEEDGFWGDFARTITVENGKVVGEESRNQGFHNGWATENDLHLKFMKEVRPEMSFDEVYNLFNEEITKKGYENLDFNKNLGHTIEKRKEDRLYFKKGEKTLLKDVNLFTFEPHIRKLRGKYGFKKENIYYFDGGKMKSL
ncbi:MAG: M24 family metallopeptidase [Candidatus Gracilibacteria bacterium]|jgi:Xaa-Pro aminopeptidase